MSTALEVLMFSFLIIFIKLRVVDGTYNLTIARTEDKKFYLLCDLKINKTSRLIPDDKTVTELFHYPDEAKVISYEEFSKYKMGPPVPSLVMPVVNADEVLRVAVQRCKALNPVGFKQLLQKPGFFNPAFVEWHGRILMAWAVASKYNGDFLDPYGEHNGEIHFAWLKEGSYTELSDETILGIGPNFFLKKYGVEVRFLEDPRLLVLNNGSLLITLGSVSIYASIFFCKTILTVNATTGVVDQPTISIVTTQEKNYVPFEHNSKIYYITHINPLKIMEVVLKDGQENLYDVVSMSEVQLPWHPLYEPHYRGSSPAIMLRGVLFSFFHTKAIIQKQVRRYTYFMGVITYCPEYPFHIHSMSKFPIVEPGWYDGPWLANNYDYIAYPTGIVLSKDNQTLYLSQGYQNQQLQILEFNVDDLFDSLTMVHDCNEKGRK